LRISAKRLARGVWLDFGALNVTLSDNAFDLLPGEHVDIQVDSTASAQYLRGNLKLSSLVDALQSAHAGSTP
jgi:beta-mannosidase